MLIQSKSENHSQFKKLKNKYAILTYFEDGFVHPITRLFLDIVAGTHILVLAAMTSCYLIIKLMMMVCCCS